MGYKNNKEIETPCFIIQKTKLEQNIEELQVSLKKYWPNYIIGYSFKTNALPWVLNYCKSKGCFAEVVSESEYALAKMLGYGCNKIIYNGPIKKKESFLEAIKNRCIVNIDSVREIKWLEELPKDEIYKIGLRVNYDIEAVCPKESVCGDEGGRFGFNLESGALGEAIECIRSFPNIRITGLHMHISSKTRSLGIYESSAQKACEIQKLFNLHLEYIDIGGGFFGGMPNRPSFEQYFKAISDQLRKSFTYEKITLIVEPGISVIGAPVDYVCKVIDVKQTNLNHFVVTDGSRIHIDPLMHKLQYFYTIGQSLNTNIMDKQVICGFTCMENDRIITLKNMQEIKVGNYITFHKVGAYTMCLTPLFIDYFPTVYLDDGEKLEVIREKWTVKEYVQRCKREV